MPTKPRYITINSREMHEFQAAVNDAIAEGYEPIGGIAFVVDRPHQAMLLPAGATIAPVKVETETKAPRKKAARKT